MKTSNLLLIGGGAALLYFLMKKKDVIAAWILPVIARVSSPYGERILNGKKVFHNGVDFAVPRGTAIKAPMAGEVVKVYTTTCGGVQMVVKHTNGWATGYAHLDRIIAPLGTKVKAGDVLALSGNTGTCTTGAHLHFTMRNDKGEQVDPLKHITIKA